jgi:exodeoxyribonuclease VII large subunit
MTRSDNTPLTWTVGALCLAISDALNSRFNPVRVKGEISGFSRAASGHCYFNLKDESGQVRCALFKRAASSVDFLPQEGDLVEVMGKLGVYGARGDLQLVVESLKRAGQGDLFAQFLKLKEKLDGEGLFASSRKRAIPTQPRAIGVVTSLGAAALHDVITALQRRVPHIPVILCAASVQGGNAPTEMIKSLNKLQAIGKVDVILLVRGGGSMEDLWAFNDEALVRAVAGSGLPIVSGVGHETDFTLVDFAADLRAPTPTAAAELAATESLQLWNDLASLETAMKETLNNGLDRMNQRLDWVAHRLGRPSGRLNDQKSRLMQIDQSLRFSLKSHTQNKSQSLAKCSERLPRAMQQMTQIQAQQLLNMSTRLGLLDPSLVLERGYAWITDENGKHLTQAHQFSPAHKVNARLSDGQVELAVL